MKKILTLTAAAIMLLGAFSSANAYETIRSDKTKEPVGTVELPFIPYQPDTSDTESHNNSSRPESDTSSRPWSDTSSRPESDTSSRPESDTSSRPESNTSSRPESDTSSVVSKIDDPSETEIKGDVDNDGLITSSDALALLRASVGLNDIKPNSITDVDNDGHISANDALLVLRRSVGIKSEF